MLPEILIKSPYKNIKYHNDESVVLKQQMSLPHVVSQADHQVPHLLTLLDPHAPQHTLHLLRNAEYQGSICITETITFKEYFLKYHIILYNFKELKLLRNVFQMHRRRYLNM